jgi:hypothetical protein
MTADFSGRRLFWRARGGSAKAHAKEETTNEKVEKVEHLAHGTPNKQETPAFPSLAGGE